MTDKVKEGVKVEQRHLDASRAYFAEWMAAHPANRALTSEPHDNHYAYLVARAEQAALATPPAAADEPYVEWCERHKDAERIPGPFCPACVMLREFKEGAESAIRAHDAGTCHRGSGAKGRPAAVGAETQAVEEAIEDYGATLCSPVVDLLRPLAARNRLSVAIKASLAAARDAERERCAEVCEDLALGRKRLGNGTESSAAQACADAIRATTGGAS